MTLETRFKKQTLAVVAALIEQINQHPRDDRTTAQYAKAACMDRKIFQAAFRYITGPGIQEYRLNRRMTIAAQLLQEGKVPIKVIADICQFKSQRAFTTAFKKRFGITPMKFQHRCD